MSYLKYIVSLRLGEEMYDNVCVIAASQEVAVSAIIRRAIRIYLRARQQAESVNVVWDVLLEEEREV